MTKCELWMAFLLVGASSFSYSQTPVASQPQDIFIDFGSLGGCASRSIAPCNSANNQVNFSLVPPEYISPSDDSDIHPRFKAFWIPGDGNYLMFDDSPTDALSRNPGPYNYAAAGNYTVSVYLTGKYTNHHPPKGGQRSISVGVPPPAPATGTNPFTPATFNRRRDSGEFDFFAIHDLRKDYLTPLVLSYPANIQKTWAYLFYNGHGSDRRGAYTSRPLEYQKSAGEVARYYNGSASNIRSYPTSSLTLGGDAGIDGWAFSDAFRNMANYYSDVVYFPLETVSAAGLPSGFDLKRYFPVFHAKPDVPIEKGDSLFSFCFIVTSDQPSTPERQSLMQALFRKLDWPLNGESPIIRDGTIERNENIISKGTVLNQDPNGGTVTQYIQGVYLSDVKYAAAHDPNALSILNVEPLPGGKFKVTFHLEMCNKGGDRTVKQYIDLFDKFGRFGNFIYNGGTLTETAPNSHRYKLESALEIQGIPEDEYKMQCKSIEFTAVTDCEGLKSLWDSAPECAFEVCVKFKEAADVECGENYPIAPCEFKVDGKCPCEKPNICGAEGWFLVFLLIFVFVLLVWKYYNDKANNL